MYFIIYMTSHVRNGRYAADIRSRLIQTAFFIFKREVLWFTRSETFSTIQINRKFNGKRPVRPKGFWSHGSSSIWAQPNIDDMQTKLYDTVIVDVFQITLWRLFANDISPYTDCFMGICWTRIYTRFRLAFR